MYVCVLVDIFVELYHVLSAVLARAQFESPRVPGGDEMQDRLTGMIKGISDEHRAQVSYLAMQSIMALASICSFAAFVSA